MEAETRRTVDLKRLIRTVEAVAPGAPVTINEHGIHLRATDTGMVALIDLHLKPEFFHQYNLAHPDQTRFQIDTGELKKRVSEARKGDTVKLAVTEEHGDRQVRLTVDDTGMKSTFTIPTNKVEDGDVPETDELKFTRSAVVSIGKLKDAFKRLGDSAQLTLLEDRLVVESSTEDGAAHIEFLEGSDHIHAIHLDDGPVTARYATDYLEHVTKLKNTVDRATLRFGTDYPLRLAANRNKFAVEYTLAPRIEE